MGSATEGTAPLVIDGHFHPFPYGSGGGRYGGIYASLSLHPAKGIVLFHGHSPDIDESGKREGAEVHLAALVEQIASAHPDWAVAGISTRGYGESWAPDQQMDWVSESTQQAAADGAKYFGNMFGLRDEQLFLWGQSEGGQIATLVAAKYLQGVAGAISYNGVLDHARFVATNHDSDRIRKSHDRKGITPADYGVRSPINYVAQLRCPVLVWYSYEDTVPVVIPDIPEAFAKALRRTNDKVIAMSFEGGHGGPIMANGSPCGYRYDWMWRDYFVPFITDPRPSTFKAVLALFDPITETAASNREILAALDAATPVLKRAAREALAFKARRGDSLFAGETWERGEKIFRQLSQRQGLSAEQKDELSLQADELRPQAVEEIIRVEHVELGRKGILHRITTPREIVEALLTHRSPKAIPVPPLPGLPPVRRSPWRGDVLECDVSENVAKRLLASKKLGRFFYRGRSSTTLLPGMPLPLFCRLEVIERHAPDKSASRRKSKSKINKHRKQRRAKVARAKPAGKPKAKKAKAPASAMKLAGSHKKRRKKPRR